jgi:hypothetical protein
MKGYYTIGVYGKKRSSYVLTATQNEHRIISMEKAVKLRNTQNPYGISYYKWYNSESGEDRDDIQIEVKVNSGKVDVYVNNYDQYD